MTLSRKGRCDVFALEYASSGTDLASDHVQYMHPYTGNILQIYVTYCHQRSTKNILPFTPTSYPEKSLIIDQVSSILISALCLLSVHHFNFKQPFAPPSH